jgi:hypothetical protein
VPLAPAAGSRWPQSGRDEYPAHRSGREFDRLLGFSQAFGHVDGVEAGKRPLSDLDYLTAQIFVRPVRRNSAPVAVNESCGSLRPQPFGQPVHLAPGEFECLRRDGGIQLSSENMGQYDEALLRPSVQRDRLPGLHGIEGDKIAVRLSRTESLSVHSTAWDG